MQSGVSVRGWMLGWVLACALLACGDDDGGGAPKDEAPEGEACAAAGIAETGCTCSEDRPLGSRLCLEGNVWGECTCPPRDDRECRPGQRVQCAACPGEAEGRVVDCREDGSYDCGCGAPDASTDADAG